MPLQTWLDKSLIYRGLVWPFLFACDYSTVLVLGKYAQTSTFFWVTNLNPWRLYWNSWKYTVVIPGFLYFWETADKPGTVGAGYRW